MTIEILMPQLGQAMVTGVILTWHVGNGEKVNKGQLLLTIESDKSAFEIDAPASGLVQHKVKEGEEVEVGALLGLVGDDSELAAQSETNSPEQTASASETKKAPPLMKHGEAGILASPRARAMAAEAKINLAEIIPSRNDGMITQKDVERALSSQKAVSAKPGVSESLEKVARGGRRQKLTSAQKTAIQRLQQSWAQAPHIVQMIEVDARKLVQAQKRIKQGALKVTLNDIILKAAADTMAEFPEINAYVDGDELVFSDTVDVSIAVATERGLRTPLVRGLERLSLEEVAEQTRDAIDAAQKGRSVTGRASLTVSNLGRYGVQFGTPVLNLNESVLVFVGAINEKPIFEAGVVVPRHELMLSIAYDHRVVDGLNAARFSDALRQRLEQFDLPGQEGEVKQPHTAGRHVVVASDSLKCVLNDDHGHKWIIDEPESIGGTDGGPDPVTTTLSALASCLIIAFRLVAKRRSVSIHRLDGSISSPESGKVKQISVHLRIESSDKPDKVKALLPPAKNACYVHAMLKAELQIEILLDVVTPTQR